MTHRELCANLAQAKGSIFVEVPLGSVFLNPRTQKADVVVIRPSYTRFCLDIFEVKTQRSDFLKDMKSEKWRGYLTHCHRLYFAVVKGVATKEEIPEGCGLLIRGDKGWQTAKGARARPVDVPRETVLSLCFYRQKREKRLVQREDTSMDIRYNLKAMGKEVAKAIQFYKDSPEFKRTSRLRNHHPDYLVEGR